MLSGARMRRMRWILVLAAWLGWPALADDRLVVELVPVAEMPLTYDVALTGTIHAKDDVDLGFRQGGRITEILVDEGNRVTPGQPLARIDPLQQQQALRVAEASVAAARALREQAGQAQERAQAMLDRGVGTRAALDAANQQYSSALRALAQAESGQDQARRALDETILRAPTEAIVTARSADPGQIVGAAQAVISLASSIEREAVFQVPDAPALGRSVGAAVSLSAIDFGNIRMTATVTEIAPMVDPQTGSVRVRAAITDPPQGIDLLGAAVRGMVHFPAGRGIAVPWTALAEVAGGPAVWIVGPDGRVSLTPVSIARFTDGLVVLRDGVQPGQTVVGAGSHMLYPGRAVVGQAPHGGGQ